MESVKKDDTGSGVRRQFGEAALEAKQPTDVFHKSQKKRQTLSFIYLFILSTEMLFSFRVIQKSLHLFWFEKKHI